MPNKRISPRKIIKEYVRDLSPYIVVDSVFLFGSFSRGDYNKDSDIDCIVISSDFKKIKNTMKRLEFLSKHRKGLACEVPMDIWGATQEEFVALKDNDSPSVRQMLKEGKFVYGKKIKLK